MRSCAEGRNAAAEILTQRRFLGTRRVAARITLMRKSPGLWEMLTPSPVEPEPLFRMPAHPRLDHAGDGLHGALNVEAPVGIARHLECLSEFAAKAPPAEAKHPHAVNRTFAMLREACQHGIGLAPPPEKDHVDP